MGAEPGEPTRPEGTDLTGLYTLLAIGGYFAACIGGSYGLTGEFIDPKGFKALGLGSGGGLVLTLVLAGLAQNLVLERLKADPVRRARAATLMSAAFLGASALFAWGVFWPAAKKDPSRYYSAPDSQYEVTYASGRKETVTGAQLGYQEWSFDVCLYFSLSLMTGVLGLYMLGRHWVEWRRIAERPYLAAPPA